MAQGLNATKTGARPSHEAIESNTSATNIGKSEQKKIDDIAMQMAKRAGNRLKRDEEDPHNIEFTK